MTVLVPPIRKVGEMFNMSSGWALGGRMTVPQKGRKSPKQIRTASFQDIWSPCNIRKVFNREV